VDVSSPEAAKFIVIFSVKGVDTVMLGRDEEDIVAAFARNFDTAEEERLCIDLSIDVEGEEFPKVLDIHIARCQGGFIQVLAPVRALSYCESPPFALLPACREQ
jgi:hypothetical protein